MVIKILADETEGKRYAIAYTPLAHEGRKGWKRAKFFACVFLSIGDLIYRIFNEACGAIAASGVNHWRDLQHFLNYRRTS